MPHAALPRHVSRAQTQLVQRRTNAAILVSCIRPLGCVALRASAHAQRHDAQHRTRARAAPARWLAQPAAGAGSEQQEQTVKMTFVDVDGEEKEVDARVGDSLLDVAHENEIEIEGTHPCALLTPQHRMTRSSRLLWLPCVPALRCDVLRCALRALVQHRSYSRRTAPGACGGEVACSTCHVIVEPSAFSKLPPASEEEEDMLDLALGLSDTCVGV